MAPALATETRDRKILAILLVTLIVAGGLCLFDSDGAGPAGHASSPDLCAAIAVLSLAVILSGLTVAGPVSLGPVRLVRIGRSRRIDPPPRPF
jgi:hypothetical protein